MLIAALGFVIFTMRAIRQPENIVAISRVLGEEEGPGAVVGAPPVNAVRIAAQNATANTNDDAPPNPAAADPDIRPEALAAIRDNAPFRTAEQAAWFALLAAAQHATTAELAARSLGDVSYVQLIAQPNYYRAKLVTVRGTVRRATAEQPAENNAGIESYYRLVIQPAGESMPIFAYCITLPDQFPLGEDVTADAEVTGFFFKNLSYQSEAGPAIAPVLLAKDISTSQPVVASTNQTPSRAIIPPSAEMDASPANRTNTTPGHEKFAELMALAGWNSERWSNFADDERLTDAERQQATELLWRLRTFDAASLNAWSSRDAAIEDLLANPQPHRGELVHLAGRVRRVEQVTLPPADAARLEMPAYFECEIELDRNAGVATVLAARVPKEWRINQPLDERAAAAGVFIKRVSTQDGISAGALFVAQNIAWYPAQVNEPTVSLGKSILGGLGMDVGQLDNIANHRPIRAEERDAFYAMLAAVNEAGANQLIRFAQGDLAEVRQAWSGELNSADPARVMLAKEVVSRAAEGRYSVAPLFNDADRQIGRLVAVEGVARRAIRVEVGAAPDGSPSDVLQYFGLDHYFEMDVFTDDSQNRPIVFCVRELPANFPTGSGLSVPIRVAGFFFKSWHYVPHPASRNDNSADDDLPVQPGRGLIAPLLIGRAPVVVLTEAPARSMKNVVGIGIFVVAFIGVWGLVWWYSRGDRQFHQRTLAPSFSLPSGQSLDDLILPTEFAGSGSAEADPAESDSAGRESS